MTLKALDDGYPTSHFYSMSFMYPIADIFRDTVDWIHSVPGYVNMVYQSRKCLHGNGEFNKDLLNKAWSIIESL